MQDLETAKDEGELHQGYLQGEIMGSISQRAENHEASPESPGVLSNGPEEEIDGAKNEEHDHGIHAGLLRIPEVEGV
jgi:hypothetical protein